MSKDTADKLGIKARFLLQHGGEAAGRFTLDVDLELPGSGITTVFGESGSGKTSLLRCLAGLAQPHDGKLSVHGETWFDASTNLPTWQRPLGYVFQEASLFPHLSAGDNLAYAVRRARPPVDPAQHQRILDIMGIERLLDRAPAGLSGGERQRVAIARALLANPRLLLMDEPLASLDRGRRLEILPYLERLRSELQLPVIYVSHDLQEVSRLADYAVVLAAGSVLAAGPAQSVFSRLDLSIARDSEAGVVLSGKLIDSDPAWQLSRIAVAGGELWVPALTASANEPGTEVRLRILARDVSLTAKPHDDNSILNRLRVEVLEVAEEAEQPMALVRLACGSDHLLARVTRKSIHHLQVHPGQALWAQIKTAAVVS
ncbi:MAG: molybdenum ABC transporter ATP-binding protein [Pseudomonadota bacterium]